jgi:hypothetical protein
MTATTTLELSSRQHLARTRESSGVCALSERSDSVQSRHDDSLGVTSESNGQTRDCNRLGQDGVKLIQRVREAGYHEARFGCRRRRAVFICTE